ncbi:uncharacterized protein NEMAJ01_0949 [Nematocida major]|uniref:uncharacterized protein n=1 Tax=Nematocida major TaxID=1912982 RepID=UPI0020082DF1|nr:uncharacterized protein NEMAJ01_0949 [Nematocida major]KAH9386053.1 hypothetical protein NEMAJ01_0949 [Nematocida major]
MREVLAGSAESAGPSKASGKKEQALTEIQIYRAFTQERGMPLSQKVIKYIQSVLSPSTIDVYADIVKASYRTGLLTEKDIESAVCEKIKKRQNIEARPVKYVPEGVIRYKLLKERVLAHKTSIVSLKPDVVSHIFGMVRVHEDGSLFIEDEDESVCVCKIEESEYFLASGVCAGFEGMLTKEGFAVQKVHLPELPAQSVQKTNSTNFLVVSQFVSRPENIKKISDVLKVYAEYEIEVSAVIIMLHGAENIDNVQPKIEVSLLKSYASTEFFIVPGTSERHFYPHGECKTYKNLQTTTNPVEIRVEGEASFLVGAFDLVDGVKKESIIKGPFRKELGKTFLTQASFNPFIPYADLSYTEEFAGVIIGDKYDCFAHKEGSKAFAICGDFEKSEGQFMFYNGSEQAFETCSVGGLSAE